MKPSGRRTALLAVAVVVMVGAVAPVARAATTAIRLSPSVGPPTSMVKVRGKGFGPNEVVDLTFDSTPVGQATTNGAGRFSASITVPASALPGGHTLTATGQSSGLTATAPFTVRTDWTRFHFDAADTGWNPYENVLGTSNVGDLVVKWSTHTPAYVSSSPAVVGGVVYVGIGPHGLDYVNLDALDAQSGTLLWSARIQAGFTSDPTVAGGVVYLGTLDDHQLHAYDAGSGKPLWTFQAVGGVSDPTVVGTTVYVPVNTGILFALDATTGKELWEAHTGKPVFALSAAVANGLVYIGSDDDKLYAFNASTGALVWSTLTQGQIESSPAVADGVVYVGSVDDNLYAMDASTGDILWKAPTGGQVNSSPAVANCVVYVGSADGKVYAFDAATGDPVWTFVTADQIVQASPVVANGVVYIGSEDDSIYALNAASGQELWHYATGDLLNDSPAVSDGDCTWGRSTTTSMPSTCHPAGPEDAAWRSDSSRPLTSTRNVSGWPDVRPTWEDGGSESCPQGGPDMPGMVPEDVHALAGVSDPRLSLDGSQVAYVVWSIDKAANEYRGAIWVAPVDGSSPARRLTLGSNKDAAPRWSPNGTQLAFTSKRDGGPAQLFVLPLAGGEANRLTDLKEDVESPEWSPDGARIAFAARVRSSEYEESEDKKRAPRRITRLHYKLDNEGWTIDRPHHLFVVPADGSGAPQQITDGDYEDEKPSWSPDGRRIAFQSARHQDWDIGTISDIYVVGSEGGEPERVTGMDGACSAPSWSPDGSRIGYLYSPGEWDDPRHGQVAVVAVEGGERSVPTSSLDRNCGVYFEGIREPLWEGNDRLVFGVEDHGNVHLYRVGADGTSQPEQVIGGDLMLMGYDAVGSTIVHAFHTPTSLCELYAGDRQLTHVGNGFGEHRELVAPERFTAVSADGSEVEAWIMKPAGFEEGRKYPLLLNIHGGPFSQYGNKFFDEFQVYAGAGYAVAYSNPRGSSGYSEEWGRAIRGPVEGGPGWGTVDYEDCIAVVDEAIKRFDFVDPDRLGVMGGSYGGYMTSWIVGHTDRFQCAISERAVNDFVSEDQESDLSTFFRTEFGAFWWDAPEEFRKHSPITYAKDITTPLLILHSDNDFRCPVGQGEALFTMLRQLKREVEFVRFPVESHELSRSGSPTHRVMRFEVVLDWLDRHLK